MFKFTAVPNPKPDSPFMPYYNDLNLKKEKLIRQHTVRNRSKCDFLLGEYSD